MIVEYICIADFYPPDRLVRHPITDEMVPEQTGEWKPCPNCGLTPKIWEYDNGRHTACGCGRNIYDHHSIHAESIGSVLRRTGGFTEYDRDGLRKNWNHWVETGEVIFDPKRDKSRQF